MITIAPISRRNHITFIAIGTVLLCLSVLMISWQWALFWLLPCSLSALVLLSLGIAKQLEPNVSLSINQRGIVYHHRRGRWYLCWHRIQRIDQVRIGDTPLAYVGIRLREPFKLVRSLSPRLALALTNEQRPLYRMAAPNSTNQCELFCNQDKQNPFVGVKGAYWQQNQTLRSGLGYDLYIPAGSLDRSPSAMISLLKQQLQQALHKPS